MLLTERAEEVDQIVGLMNGADDYLAKPVSLRLLIAKVAAVLRRGAADPLDPPVTTLGKNGLLIDLEGRTVTVHDQPIELTKIQFDLLAALAENPERVLTREQLVQRVWGDWFSDDHLLDVHLSRLRAKIAAAGGPRIATAVRGVGFKL